MDVFGYILLLLAVIGAQFCLRRTALCEKALFWLPDHFRRAEAREVYFPHFEVVGKA
jgi:hypothetical protein